jgi:hypothetical protein
VSRSQWTVNTQSNARCRDCARSDWHNEDSDSDSDSSQIVAHLQLVPLRKLSNGCIFSYSGFVFFRKLSIASVSVSMCDWPGEGGSRAPLIWMVHVHSQFGWVHVFPPISVVKMAVQITG